MTRLEHCAFAYAAAIRHREAMYAQREAVIAERDHAVGEAMAAYQAAWRAERAAEEALLEVARADLHEEVP